MENVLIRLQNAINDHDIEAFVSCFSENYNSEQPIHPDRTFAGREQVRKNWTANFNEMPDFRSNLVRYKIDTDTVWSEWDWQGTRHDESILHMRGVIIFGVAMNMIKWGRLYMEPVENEGKGIDAAVATVMVGRSEQ